MSQDHTRLPPTRGEGQGRKARPILFSGPMVRALLAGSKTQTRRIVKPQPDFYGADGSFSGFPLGDGASTTVEWKGNHTSDDGLRTFCPYGVPGDLLWVRESIHQPNAGGFIYRANWREQAKADGYDNIPEDESATRWTPSIHMPRIASRLTLEIIEVRVERLQDISEADAQAEGCERAITLGDLLDHQGTANASYYLGYSALWDAINGDGSWAANPWVWAVSFNVHRQNVDALTHPHPPGGNSHGG